MNKLLSSPDRIAMALGALATALILGALGFEYLDGLPPCEICMWQRYPHVAAIIVGLGGGLLLRLGVLPRELGKPVAMLAALLIGVSGAIAVYHAGVEWKLWAGPSHCTGSAFHSTGPIDFNAPIVMCDQAAWRLFGLSLAGYNAMISLGAALLGLVLVARSEKTS